MKQMPSDSFEPVREATLGLIETERHDPEWSVYEKKYLKQVEWVEGFKLVYQALREINFDVATTYKQLRLKRLAQNVTPGSKESEKIISELAKLGPDITFAVEERSQLIVDRLWEAGYMSVGSLAIFKVKRGAPYPPVGDGFGYRDIPTPGLELGSKPYKLETRPRGGKRPGPSQLEEKVLLSLATSFPLSYGITAMHQRAMWGVAEQGAFKVERGYPVHLKKEKVHIVYFLGELEFEDDLHPQPFGAAQSAEILKRWGLLHSFLHAGLCVALSETHGRGVELGEKDLLFISGLKASVEKGHIRKAAAIERIRAALRDLGTLSAAVRSTDKRIETSRFPLFIAQPIVVSEDGEARSIAAKVEPGHWAKQFFGFDKPNYAIPRELFTLPAGLPSWLGIWLTANVWRFDKGRRVPLRKVLEGAIPRVKPEHPEEWEGHSITWVELEPTERTPQAAARMKECRKTLREQLSRAERELAAHNIMFKIHGDRRTGTTWENFLDSPTSLSIVGVEARPPLLDRVLDAAPLESRLTGATIKAALNAAGMKQGELATALGISPAVVTRWLKPEGDPTHRPISPKHEPRIRELLKID